MVPENPDVITTEQKLKSLRTMNHIKEKRCGKIKWQTYDNGSTQMRYIPREHASSLIISIEALITTLLVYTYEGWGVAIFGVPGAYLKAYMTDMKYSSLKLEGEFMDIMRGINSDNIPNIHDEN